MKILRDGQNQKNMNVMQRVQDWSSFLAILIIIHLVSGNYHALQTRHQQASLNEDLSTEKHTPWCLPLQSLNYPCPIAAHPCSS